MEETNWKLQDDKQEDNTLRKEHEHCMCLQLTINDHWTNTEITV